MAKRTRTLAIDIAKKRVKVQLADLDGNPLPADAELSAKGVPAIIGGACTATINGSVIGNSIEPTSHIATWESCVTGDTIQISVKVGGTESFYEVQVP